MKESKSEEIEKRNPSFYACINESLDLAKECEGLADQIQEFLGGVIYGEYGESSDSDKEISKDTHTSIKDKVYEIGITLATAVKRLKQIESTLRSELGK